MGWFHCTIYSYIGTVLHQIPVPDPSYDCYGFVCHTRWGGEKDKFIQWGKEIMSRIYEDIWKLGKFPGCACATEEMEALRFSDNMSAQLNETPTSAQK
jgi:hypothetical protein